MIVLNNIYKANNNQNCIAQDTWIRDVGVNHEILGEMYALLEEREAYQSISHKKMPTFEEHSKFVLSDPYKCWFRILKLHTDGSGVMAGTIYLTRQNEIGIQLFKRFTGQGIGKQAVEMLMQNNPGPFYANINPDNKGSIRFFEKLGAKHIQNTYVIEEDSHEKADDNTNHNTDKRLN